MDKFLKRSEGFSFVELEAIRKNMVFAYDIDGKWDIDGAFTRFEEFRVQGRRTAGFC
jgi:hypothetical protein